MHRPRRTSEFHEEPGTATKRTSRIPRVSSQGPSPAPRHTVRGPSFTGSVTRKTGVTPLKTPSHSARVLFTAEKQRSNANLPLHNDKKWVQEQAQRISDYLRRSCHPGVMAGITEDFLARPNCLKQMSIKQFVSIINYFLQFIWGNRFAVGTNYVEDIVNILHKLNYPYQVNKSWLKTPNTTLSFGNVIVLFDFLMDFVPEPDYEFPLEELQEHTMQSENDRLDPDLQYKATLLHNCQESFHLWDKQMDNEFAEIKRQTADLLVQKRCGIASLKDLDVEIERLTAENDVLQQQRPYIDPEDEKECKRLKKSIKKANLEIEQLYDAYDRNNKQIEDILGKQQLCLAEVEDYKKENRKYEKAIMKQICDVKERDAYIEKTKLLRMELHSYERTIDDLRDRDHRQQVQLSVVKMKCTEQIENINKTLRDLIYTLSINDKGNQLQIPLNAECKDVERLAPKLKALSTKTEKKIEKYTEELNQLDTNIEKFNREITVTLQPKLKSLKKGLKKLQETSQKSEQQVATKSEHVYTKIQSLDLQNQKLEAEIELMRKIFADNKVELQKLEKENEETLAKLEDQHQQYATAKKEFLDKCAANLDAVMKDLQEAEIFVERNKGS